MPKSKLKEESDEEPSDADSESASDHLEHDVDEQPDGIDKEENSGEIDPAKDEEEEDPDAEIQEENNEVGDEEIIEDSIEENPKKAEKGCYLKNIEEDVIFVDEDDSRNYSKMEYRKVEDKNRISGSNMTYYEMVRVIGTRAQQFNQGAVPLVKGIENLPPPQMAYIELMKKMTPFIIRRNLPGKLYEEWKISELDIIHEISDDFFVSKNFNL